MVIASRHRSQRLLLLPSKSGYQRKPLRGAEGALATPDLFGKTVVVAIDGFSRTLF
jgi:hypothetical protein